MVTINKNVVNKEKYELDGQMVEHLRCHAATDSRAFKESDKVYIH